MHANLSLRTTVCLLVGLGAWMDAGTRPGALLHLRPCLPCLQWASGVGRWYLTTCVGFIFMHMCPSGHPHGIC